jgi:Tfp pilus assembly protein PilO
VKRAGDSRMIFAAVGIAAVLFLFYFMVLGPKRDKASSLGDEVTELESSIDQQKQVTQFAEEARQDFPRYYGRLVVLGKAVPEQADSASMLVQVNGLALGAGVDFRGIELSQGGEGADASAGGATAGSTAAPPTTGTESSGGTPPPSEAAPPATEDTGATPASTTTGTTPVPATEAAAASQPIGAVLGPGGLPTLPYDVTMSGDFFGVADFMAGVDRLVTTKESNGQVSANGRLLTVDGFALSDPTPGSVPTLQIDFSLTSYVTPAEQGLTAGASPGGPAPAPAAPEATPASSTVAP